MVKIKTALNGVVEKDALDGVVAIINDTGGNIVKQAGVETLLRLFGLKFGRRTMKGAWTLLHKGRVVYTSNQERQGPPMRPDKYIEKKPMMRAQPSVPIVYNERVQDIFAAIKVAVESSGEQSAISAFEYAKKLYCEAAFKEARVSEGWERYFASSFTHALQGKLATLREHRINDTKPEDVAVVMREFRESDMMQAIEDTLCYCLGLSRERLEQSIEDGLSDPFNLEGLLNGS